MEGGEYNNPEDAVADETMENYEPLPPNTRVRTQEEIDLDRSFYLIDFDAVVKQEPHVKVEEEQQEAEEEIPLERRKRRRIILTNNNESSISSIGVVRVKQEPPSSSPLSSSNSN